MKSLHIFILFALFMLGAAKKPSDKCRENIKTPEDEQCIGFCEYTHYKMISTDFKLEPRHINQYANVLVKYDGIDKAKKNELLKHIKSCAKKVKITNDMNRNDKCKQVTKYYQCIVVDSNLLEYDRYAQAMIAYDATIKLKP
uniref:PpSP15-like protein n=1 Tax=Sergentomyia schwetzi TaxID=114605 RepID=A0A6B9VM56_9DIPT|nr:PpSP15-like protein [Sergentomyia schwetzi]